MRKSLTITAACCLLLLAAALALSACGSRPSASSLQTAVAGTLARLPAQPAGATQLVEVTRAVEVTQIVERIVTTTPRPAEKATQTATAQPAGETPTPQANPASAETATETAVPIVATGRLGMSFNQLMHQYASMTDLQKQEFGASLPGKTVSWTGQVYNITTDGTLILDNPYAAGRVTLKGIPIETAMKIDKGMLVDFTGMIESFEGSYLTEIVVVNGKVLRYYEPPTETPRPHR